MFLVTLETSWALFGGLPILCTATLLAQTRLASPDVAWEVGSGGDARSPRRSPAHRLRGSVGGHRRSPCKHSTVHDARATSQVSGHKSDVPGCQWIVRLMSHGLFTGACRPADHMSPRSHTMSCALVTKPSAAPMQAKASMSLSLEPNAPGEMHIHNGQGDGFGGVSANPVAEVRRVRTSNSQWTATSRAIGRVAGASSIPVSSARRSRACTNSAWPAGVSCPCSGRSPSPGGCGRG